MIVGSASAASSNQKFYETPKGIEIIREKIKKLDNDLAILIPDALNKAAAFGDRSENAEYDEAKRWQRDSQEELGNLKQYLSNVVMAPKQKCYDHVVFGSYVKLLENEIQKTYKIVGKYESDASKGFIFYGSPIGKILLNKKTCDCFEFETPSKKIHEYEVLEIGYYEDAC